MSSFKFGQIEVTSKYFHKQGPETDILTIDVNKVVLFDGVPCNNGKAFRLSSRGRNDHVIFYKDAK